MDVDLNSDLGEGAPHDAELLRLVTSANVSCGAHAGDEAAILATLKGAKAAGVVVGAHPGYADREHFGRSELALTEAEIHDLVVQQLATLAVWAESAGVAIRYLKPHGAMYNQACCDDSFARPIVAAAEELGLPILALPGSRLEVLSRGRVPFIAEGFADRRYRADGSLVPRSQPDALMTDPRDAVTQALRLVAERGVRSLCVHGDHPEALEFVRELRRAFSDAGHRVTPFLRGES